MDLRDFLDYTPIFLILILFAAEKELSKHTFSVCCQSIITLGITIMFFFIFTKLQSKYASFIVCCAAWILLVYVKRIYLKTVDL